MQGFSLFKVVLLWDVTSNTMLFLLKSKGTAIYYFFFSKPKKKKVTGCGRSQEFIKKPHFKNGSTKISVLNVRIDSMQHLFPFFCFFFFFQFLAYGLRLILVGWEGAHAFQLILKAQAPDGVHIQWFCLYTLLRCYRANNLSHVGEIRGPSICHPTALTERKGHTWTFGARRARLSVCCSVAQRRQVVFGI